MSIKSVSFNVADLFESVADAVPERTALVSGEIRYTFAELEARANRAAHALRARGVRAGDHVGLYLYNGHTFIETMLGAFKIRAVPININYRYVDDELLYLCDNADLAVLIHEPDLAARVDAVKPRAPKLRATLAAGADYEQALAAAPPHRDFAQRSGDDLYIIYTGGTTGMPRGVMWRHEDVFFAGLQGGNPGGPALERADQLAETVRNRASAPTFLPAAPFIHGAAQWAALIGLFMGSKVVLAPGKSFDARTVAGLIQTERVNTMTLVGDAMARPLAAALADGKYDTSSLLVISSAGAILSASVKTELQARLGMTMILNNFGATETGHQGNGVPVEGLSRPRFFMDASNMVLGDDDKPLARGSGKLGRLARRGRIPQGYYKDPAKTAASFPVINGERWAVPGDLATVEADGSITVFGRGAVCINSGGEKIFPEEVEEALKAHPLIMDAVVIGVPDDKWGQRVAAVVQPRNGADITLADIDLHCRTRIAGYKVPRQLRVIDQIVRHPSGKPDYRWALSTLLEA